MASTLRACLCALALLGVSARQAHAYRTAAELPEIANGALVRWPSNTVEFEFSARDLPGLTMGEALLTLEEGLAAWSAPDCSAVSMRVDRTSSELAAAGDGINTIQFVTDWEAMDYDTSAAAITDIQIEEVGAGRWDIVEADIYLNGSAFAWQLRGDGDERSRDLLSVITHEGGHALGLLHVCEAEGADGAPDCSSDDSFRDSTMFPIYDGALQATLADDDIAGVCDLYPRARCEETGCMEGQTCRSTDCGVRCSGATCDPGEQCNDGGCVRTDRDAAPAESDARTECDDHHADASAMCADAGHLDGGPDARPFGAHCDVSSDCVDGECLAGLTDEPVCTRACGSRLTECPTNWDCIELQQGRVCQPRMNSGCTAGTSSGLKPSSNARSTALFFFLLLIGLTVTRRSRSDAWE